MSKINPKTTGLENASLSMKEGNALVFGRIHEL